MVALRRTVQENSMPERVQFHAGFVVLPEESSSVLFELDQMIHNTGDVELITSWEALPVSHFKNKVLISDRWAGYINPIMITSKKNNYKQIAKLVKEFEDSLNAVDTNLDTAIQAARGLNSDLSALESKLDKALKKSVLAP